MVKKVVKKKSSRKKPTKKRVARSSVKPKEIIKKEIIHHEDAAAKTMVANFLALQKVMTNLVVKLDDVSTKMTKLLDLFEISAKSLADQDFKFGGMDKNMEKKLDNLVEQNKVIARGLTMMYERGNSNNLNEMKSAPVPEPAREQPKPLPKMTQPKTQIPQQVSQPNKSLYPPQPISGEPRYPPQMQQGMNPNNSQINQQPQFNPAVPGYQRSISGKHEEEHSDEPIQR